MTDSQDMIVIGGGGAGLTAALYASRAKLKTLLFEKLTPGGQIFLTDVVENYPGFPEGVTGPEITEKMLEQAKKYGAQIKYEDAVQIEEDAAAKLFRVKTAKNTYFGKSIVLASGAKFKQLDIPNEKEFTGRGVSYCATCDGAFFKDKDVFVIGGGDSALQEAIFLTRFASNVTIVHRRDKLRASMILQDRARNNPKISFIWKSVPVAILGSQKVESIRLKNVETGAESTHKVSGVFIFIGHAPSTEFLKGFVALDEHGYVVADADYETSRPGVFAAGEIRKGAVRQLVSACGEGCGAALSAQHFLEDL